MVRVECVSRPVLPVARCVTTNLLLVLWCCALLCCAVGDDNIVRVEFVYEPPQQGSQDDLIFERGTPQEAQVSRLGHTPLGTHFGTQLGTLLGVYLKNTRDTHIMCCSWNTAWYTPKHSLGIRLGTHLGVALRDTLGQAFKNKVQSSFLPL
jgi:hypothetical protein